MVPTALEDTYLVGHDNSLNVVGPGILANDTDLNDDTLALTLVSNVTHGQLNLSSDGSFLYTPDSNYVGSDAFTYRISDGVVQSEIVEVTLTVANAIPDASSDSFRIVHDQTYSTIAGALFRNDFDADGDSFLAELVSNPGNGTVMLAANGSFAYSPTAGFTGYDRFEYRVSDGHDESEPATVFLVRVLHSSRPIRRASPDR